MSATPRESRAARKRLTRSAQNAVVTAGVIGAVGAAGAIGLSQVLGQDATAGGGAQTPSTQQRYQVQVLPAQRGGERDDDEGARIRLVPVTPQRQQPPQSSTTSPTAPQGGSHATTSGS